MWNHRTFPHRTQCRRNIPRSHHPRIIPRQFQAQQQQYRPQSKGIAFQGKQRYFTGTQAGGPGGSVERSE